MNKLNNFIKSKTFLITLTLIFIALIIAGVTYAWYTWSSTDNTNVTMQIGEYTVVTFTNGNAININNLTPIYNYTDGESTTFNLTNNNTDVTKLFKYNVYLDITSIANELVSTSLKYVLLDGSNNIVNQGNFSDASSGSTITITEDQTLPSGSSSYTFIIYLDGNEQNNTNMINKSLSGSLRVIAVKSVPPNPLSDYIYILGSNQTEITHLSSEALFNDKIVYVENMELEPYITIENDDILLVRYIGDNPIVSVPKTYNVAGNTYNVKLLSETRADVGNNDYWTGVFLFNKLIEEVYLNENIDVITSDVYSNLYGSGMMNHTFLDCTSLVNVPVIPSSITRLYETFSGCTSLVNAPEIPNSVTDMDSTFSGCTSLINAPVIPSSVTNMGSTFFGCTSLAGTVRINSSSVGNSWSISYGAKHPFNSTTNNITVEVPLRSTTYTSINDYLPLNVTVTTFIPE